ncbi:WD-40 repeat-containing protein [Naegleria gruberi]|uniref:WD-40 repeat-containing protein n=1 Tax=Naegleria gruberi TaxID=5762 RepID=D2V217_NAEGR|nr:WD-40 repeat-containing protein [Naegleria gruberi]EFC48976.1 WD-40 repeat-containing protein [Naegleria gruberi]|eukprot:XP_002681720.1 WD-40 repeat-containing protein [Naegleria gruberi strain NEG-M]
MSLKNTVIFWNDLPPSFRYTCASVIKDKLVTGTNSGICVLWNFDQESTSYVPFSLMYGHQTKVTDCCECSYDSASTNNNSSNVKGPLLQNSSPLPTPQSPSSSYNPPYGLDNNNCCCSISLDGTVCVWNLYDGRCMALSPNLLFDVVPQCICNLNRYSNYNSSIVAISGKHNMIYLLDLNRLKIIRVLEGHTEWIASLSSGPFIITDDVKSRLKSVMLSVGDDHSLKYWSFELDEKTHTIKSEEPLFSIQAPIANQPNVQQFKPVMVVNNYYWSLVAAVYNKVVYIYTYHSIQPIYTITLQQTLENELFPLSNNSSSIRKNEKFKGALFIAKDLLLLHTSKGNAFIYKIPSTGRQRIKSIMDEVLQFYSTDISPKQKQYDNNDGLLYMADEENGNANDFGAAIEQSDTGDDVQLGITVEGVTPRSNTTSESASVATPSETKKDKRVKNLQLIVPERGITESKSNTSLKSEDESPTTPSTTDIDMSSNDLTSIGAAIERAFSTSIMDALQLSSSPSTPNFDRVAQKEQPKIVKVIDSALSENDPYGDFVWQYDPISNILLRVNNDVIIIWKVTISSSTVDITLLSSDNRLAKGWNTSNTVKENSLTNKSPISVSHFAVERISPCLIRGFHNGDVHIQYTTTQNNGKEDSQELYIQNAHKKRVTTLLVMSDDDNNPLLLSGSADYSIKVWQLDSTDLKYHKLLRSFNYHSGKVDLLFVPPRTIRRKLQNCFCSLSDDDHSVIMYSVKTLDVIHILGGHGSTVVAIYWRSDLDYLLVQCSDGTVYVWSISTGLLERRVSGASAKYLIKTSEQSSVISGSFGQSDPSTSSGSNSQGSGSIGSSGIVKLSFSKQSATSEAYNKAKGFIESISLQVNEQTPDIQLLTISVRRCVTFINSKKNLFLKYFSDGDLSNTSVNPEDEIENRINDRNMSALLTSLSYLLQYGNDPSLKQLRHEIRFAILRIQGQHNDTSDFSMIDNLAPYPKGFIGLKGAGETYSLIVPSMSDNCHPFIFSPVLSSIYMIGAVSVLTAISANLPATLKFQKTCNDCITYFLNQIHTGFDNFQEPSFLWCAQFLKDQTKDVQQAARSVMYSVLQRMEPVQHKLLAEKLANMIIESSNKTSSKQINTQRQNFVVALALLAYRVPRAVDGRIATLTAMELIDILEKGGPQHSTAITLLGDAYSIWKFYIPDPMGFCRQLFQISLPALTSQVPSSNSSAAEISQLAIDSLQAFVNMASADTPLYIDFITNIISNAQQTSTTTLNAAISSLFPVMQRHPKCLMDHLVVLTSLLLKVLDPHFPAIRDICMANSTNILRFMVEIYPMVSFHQEKQKLAVGSINDGTVCIYDMRTASKWQLFEAHQKQPQKQSQKGQPSASLDALSFSPNGQYLCSFSAAEKTCKVWNTDAGSGGTILQLLGVTNRNVKTFEIDPNYVRSPLKPMEILKFVRFEWDNNKMFSLKPGKNLNKVTFRL